MSEENIRLDRTLGKQKEEFQITMIALSVIIVNLHIFMRLERIVLLFSFFIKKIEKNNIVYTTWRCFIPTIAKMTGSYTSKCEIDDIVYYKMKEVKESLMSIEEDNTDVETDFKLCSDSSSLMELMNEIIDIIHLKNEQMKRIMMDNIKIQKALEKLASQE